MDGRNEKKQGGPVRIQIDIKRVTPCKYPASPQFGEYILYKNVHRCSHTYLGEFYKLTSAQCALGRPCRNILFLSFHTASRWNEGFNLLKISPYCSYVEPSDREVSSWKWRVPNGLRARREIRCSYILIIYENNLFLQEKILTFDFLYVCFLVAHLMK
jgi:hypothetical protein